MKYRTHLFIVFLFLLTVCSYAATLPMYDVVELNLPSGVWVNKINNNREMLGHATVAGKHKQILYHNGTYTVLNDSTQNMQAVNFNDVGQVLLTPASVLDNGAWIWDNGVLRDLGTYNGNKIEPVDINNNGQMTCVVQNRSYLWDNGAMTNLGTLGGEYCWVGSINDKGQIVGISRLTDRLDVKNTDKAFLYENGVMRDIGIYGAASYINEAGQFTVKAYSFPSGLNKIFLGEGENLTDTDFYKNYYNTYSIWLSDNGTIYYQSDPKLIWTKESDSVELDSLLPDGYTVTNIASVNGKGEILCDVKYGSTTRRMLLVPSQNQAVIAPLFSHKSSQYGNPIHVKITCPTENAVIHYTTNGSDPTENDPMIVSGSSLTIDEDTILKAKAWKSGFKPSCVRKSQYTIRPKTWKGLALVSVPVHPSDADPKLTVGFSNNYWYTYNPSSKNYAGYPDQYTWFDLSKDNSIRGYWAKFSKETPVAAGKYPIPGRVFETYIYLKPGWNLIGHPFTTAYKWDTSKIFVSGQYLKYAGASVYPYLWGWKQSVVNPYTGSYYRVGDPSVFPDAVDTMEPFEGYWIRAKKECRLQLPIPVDNQ
ncbi:MAG: chitobiase/beta-hexosaminidase C-terminal domain-containing protein [Armatimonadota bacterium]